MRKALKALEWIAYGVLCLLMGVAALLLCVVIWPSILINTHTLGIAAHLAVRSGYNVHWDAASVRITSPELLRKRLELEFRNLCVTSEARPEKTRIDGCLEHAAVAVEASFARLKPRIREIGPIDLSGADLALVLPRAKEGAKPAPARKKGTRASTGVPKWLAGATIRPIHVDLGRLRLRQEGGRSASGSLNIDSGTEGRGARVAVRAGLESAGDRLSLDAILANPAGFWQLPGWSVDTRARAELANGGAAGLAAKAKFRGGGAMDYSLHGSWLEGRRFAVADVSGDYAADHVRAVLKGSARHLSGPVELVWTHDCELELRRVGGESSAGTVSLRCPVEAKVPLPPKGFPPVRFPTEAGVVVQGDLRTASYPPDPSEALSGHVRVDLEPILTPVFRGEGRIDSNLAGVPADFPRGWKLDTMLGLRAGIPHFGRLVKQLSGTPWDVPAPIRVLKGFVELGVEGRFDVQRGEFPVSFRSRLGSHGSRGKQALDIDATGKVHWNGMHASPPAQLTADVQLSDVELQLPRLEKRPPPRLFPDSRIQGASAERPITKKKPFLAYSFRIHTPSDSPVRIITNLAQAPVPIAIDVSDDQTGALKGNVKVLDFPFEVFRRQATLDHFNVTLASPSSNSTLDGAIKVPYTDYTITILVLGTTDKPVVKLESDPPLPEDQLWAVLLFGQPLDELDPTQSDTVGNTRGAVANGAISLGSMFLLASTPIESIGYDSQTGAVTMKVRLAEGTSLNIQQGSSQLQSVGIRKRLGPSWSITTNVDRPPDASGQEVTAFLEWSHRY